MTWPLTAARLLIPRSQPLSTFPPGAKRGWEGRLRTNGIEAQAETIGFVSPVKRSQPLGHKLGDLAGMMGHRYAHGF
jgi:hypothetical protein